MNVQREDVGSPDLARTGVNDWMLPVVKKAFTSGFVVFPMAFRGRLATVTSRCGTSRSRRRRPVARPASRPSEPSAVPWMIMGSEPRRTGGVVAAA